MEAMIKKQRIRASDSQNPKKTAFRVRKLPISQAKIDRYVKEHPAEWPGSSVENVHRSMSPAATPGGVSCYTPSNTGILSPQAVPFSHQSPPGDNHHFGDPILSLPNSPSVAQMRSSFHIQAPSPIPVAALVAPSSGPVEMDDIMFTEQNSAPFSIPTAPLFYDYEMLQDGAIEPTHNGSGLSASPYSNISFEDYTPQTIYTGSSQLLQGPVTFQKSPNREAAISNSTSIGATASASMLLSEVYASLILSVEDAQAIDQYEADPQTSDALLRSHTLAVALCRRGRYEAAKQIHQKTLEIRQDVLKIEHPDTQESMHQLAVVLCFRGHYEIARQMHQRTLEVRQKNRGVRHPATLESMHVLALALLFQGKYGTAEEMLQQILELKEKTLGKEHPDTLSGINDLAMVFYKQGKYDKAEEMFQQLLELSKKVLGREHPDTLAHMNSLALVFYEQGKYDEAENMLQQIPELSKKVLGEEHPDTLIYTNNLALVFYNQGKYNISGTLLQQTLELSKKVLGEEHPNTQAKMRNFSIIFRWRK